MGVASHTMKRVLQMGKRKRAKFDIELSQSQRRTERKVETSQDLFCDQNQRPASFSMSDISHIITNPKQPACNHKFRSEERAVKIK